MGWLFDAIRRWRFRRARQLYSFFDGVRTRRIDPGRTWLAMLDDESFNFETDTEDAVALEEPAYSAYLTLICRHFGVERFDPQTERGLTDDELLSLADRFIAYVMAQKKSSSDSPTMPSSSATTLPGESGKEATPSWTSDSGLTSSDHASGEPGTSSVASDKPSATPATTSSSPPSPTEPSSLSMSRSSGPANKPPTAPPAVPALTG